MEESIYDIEYSVEYIKQMEMQGAFDGLQGEMPEFPDDVYYMKAFNQAKNARWPITVLVYNLEWGWLNNIWMLRRLCVWVVAVTPLHWAMFFGVDMGSRGFITSIMGLHKQMLCKVL